ncbi:MAG: oxidoreductase [Bacteroidetes bacterium]|nr:MAG: oxidoreductase [Bacteroidota bacterium]
MSRSFYFLTHRLMALLTLIFIGFGLNACQTSEDNSTPSAAQQGIINPAWVVQHTDTTTNYIGLFAVDENIVWASGSGGVVTRTTDGGESWTSSVVDGASSLAFRDIHAFNESTAYVLSIGNGTDSRIYQTDDAGMSWNLVFENQDENSFFDCLSFWDEDRGIAFSDSYEGEFRLIRTLDGGASWSDVPDDQLPDAHPGEGAFASSGTCLVTRAGGLGWFSTGASGIDTRVIRTADYGVTWEAAPTPIESGSGSAGIFTLSFLDDEMGVAMGGDYSARDSLLLNTALTMDGGASWTTGGQSTIRGSIFGVSYVPGSPSPTLIAVAPTGSDISTDNGASWTSFSTDDFWSVAGISPTAVWAAGPGRLARLQSGPASDVSSSESSASDASSSE